RPTSFRRDPDSLAGTLAADELRLYRLIWQRAIASQMAAKELETTTIELADEDEAERALPPLADGDVTSVRDVTPTQHFTEPPPRFTEATLIKALEEH